MDIKQGLVLLRKQIDRIEDLRKPPGFNPQYAIWKNTTIKILKDYFEESYVDMLERAGPSRVSMGKEDLYYMYLETLDEQKHLLEGFISEYESLLESPVDISKSTVLADYDFHPVIKTVSQRLFDNKHYAQSIEEAFKRVINEVKRLMIEKHGKSYDGGDSMMNHAFGCERQDPVIKFNNLSSEEEKNEQKGIMYLFKGIVGIRNRKAHENVILDDPMKAIEYLALGSLLLRLLELSKKYE